jgi:hypothetical protein
MRGVLLPLLVLLSQIGSSGSSSSHPCAGLDGQAVQQCCEVAIYQIAEVAGAQMLQIVRQRQHDAAAAALNTTSAAAVVNWGDRALNDIARECAASKQAVLRPGGPCDGVQTRVQQHSELCTAFPFTQARYMRRKGWLIDAPTVAPDAAVIKVRARISRARRARRTCRLASTAGVDVCARSLAHRFDPRTSSFGRVDCLPR